MKKPNKAKITEALKTLREALSNRFGDDAANAGQGDGCNIDVRCAGIDLVGLDGDILIEDGEPDEVADELLNYEED